MQRALLMLSMLVGCDDGGPVATDALPGSSDAAQDASPLTDGPDECAGPGRDKIKFPRGQSCGNDGSVEWCIPENDQALRTTLTAISSTIRCSSGGGRAGCNDEPGLLLCTYPTAYPDECQTYKGEMLPAVWDNICEIAAQPQITEIVHTLFE